MVRAKALSVEFAAQLHRDYPIFTTEEAGVYSSNILYDFAHTLGKADARHYFRRFNVTSSSEKMCYGPVINAYLGKLPRSQ